MLPPVRCHSCGSPIGQYFEGFFASIRARRHADSVLDEMDIDACCRIHFITSPRELSNMCVMMSNERIHEDGCEIVETNRPAENTIRVQRALDRDA